MFGPPHCSLGLQLPNPCSKRTNIITKSQAEACVWGAQSLRGVGFQCDIMTEAEAEAPFQLDALSFILECCISVSYDNNVNNSNATLTPKKKSIFHKVCFSYR